jgi:murein DD-endopeptidase MepM/ murein hydrolase activator NlpD
VQLIITDARLARSHAIQLSGLRLLAFTLCSSLILVVLSAMLYHWVFLKGAREGWPVIGTLVRLVVKDEVAQRDRFLRENIDVMARKLGEMQAKMTQLESLGERVSGLAGVNPAEIRAKPGSGGMLIPGPSLTMEELQATLAELDQLTNQRTDVLTVIESRLFEQRIKKMMVPTQAPVLTGILGSTFGWRIDPFTGRSALHTGLDFPAEPGTPIYAAAGGVVVTQEFHPQYGNMIEIDHGNDLITRYGHSSRVFVKKGDLIKRGQKIAEVGTTGRSTGPHLHFEVLVQGVPQDPQKFLIAGSAAAPAQVAQLKAPAATGPATSLPVATVAVPANAASAVKVVPGPATPAPSPVPTPPIPSNAAAARPAPPAAAASAQR